MNARVKSWDVIAYTYHADIYCLPCGEKLDSHDPEGNPKHPVFADEEDTMHGRCCAGCLSYVLEGDAPSEHYFVVVARQNDDGTYTFEVDDETLMARFPEGAVWYDDEWHKYTSDLVRLRDRALADSLSDLL